jgi:hypothetical protein
MADRMQDIKSTLAKDLERLQTLRDEVRVRLHLASMDAKTEWRKIEDEHLLGVEKAASDVTEASRDLVGKAISKVEAFRRALD